MRASTESLRRNSDAASVRSSASAASAALAADIEKLRHVRQTKYLFNEGQKIAYVGLCQLAIRERKCERYVSFPKESDDAASAASLGGKNKKANKKRADQFPPECAAACESYDYWGHKFMRQLYQHMDILPSEQEMIMQLGEHGVTASDMAESLTGEILLDPKYTDHLRTASRDSIDSPSQASVDFTPPASEATDADYGTMSSDSGLVRSNVSSPSAEALVGDEAPMEKDSNGGILARLEDAASNLTNDVPEIREPELTQCETAQGAPGTSAVEGQLNASMCARILPDDSVPQDEVHPLTSKNLALMEATQEPVTDGGVPLDIRELQSSLPALIVQSKYTPSEAVKGSIASASSEDDAEVDDRVRLDIRFTIACDLFLLLIAHGVYDSRSRDFLRTVAAKRLGLDWSMLTRFERRVAEQLQLTDVAETPAEGASRETTRRRSQKEKRRRYLMMGLASIGGSLMLGLTAGLAAPVIGAGLGAAFTTIGVSGTTAFLGGTGGAALITTGAALTGGGMAAKGMANRTRGVSTFEFVPIHNHRRVALLIGVCGWGATTGSAKDQSLPFSTVDPRWAGDVAAVRWEPEMLLELGSALKLIAGEVLSFAAQEVLRHTMLSVVMAGLAWPMTLTKLGYLVDNPWFVGLDRAARAGLVLADTLLARTTGSRPVTLAGFSLGARVIFFALLELARVHAFGIVEDVYLFGAPLTPTTKEWQQAACVVAGKLVNGYVRSDWVLGFLFRATTGGLRNVAGLHPAPGVPGIVSEDVSHLVNGHMQYRASMPRLLQLCGVIVTSETFEEENEKDEEILEAEKDPNAVETMAESSAADKKGTFGATGSVPPTSAPVWDLEEIRRELADFDTHVRELPSSLPQLVVNTTKPDNQPEEKARKELADLNTHIRELPSSMPPLVLNADQETRPSSRDC